MREGWAKSTLGDVCQFENGDRGKNYPGRKAFVPSGVSFINAGHLNDGAIEWGSMNFISHEHFNRLSNGKVQKGDLLFCLRGSLGKFGVIDKDTKGAIASSLVIVRPGNKIDSRFLAAYFRSDLCCRMIDRFANGAAQPNLSAKCLRLFEIPLPPLPEQKRIVAVLDEAFAGIATAVANTEKNLANARELFESYLNSAFSRMHDTCEMKAISQIAAVKGGKRVPKGYKLETNPTAFPYITVSAFTDEGGIDPSGVKYMDEDVYKQISRYVITISDVYISIAGTIGKTGIIPDDLDGANLTENACRLVLQPGVFNRFVYFFTKTVSFADQALKNTRVAAQPKLALERLKTITLPIPPRKLQEQMVSEFDGLLTEVRRLEGIQHQKLNALVELKQSLLQKAFSGELTTASQDEIETALA